MSAETAISVVVPARDARRYLGEALASARDQRPAPAEVIVVDDGSRDDSARIALDLGACVVHQPPRGIGAARNLGAKTATGDLLAFLDADDLFPPGRLAVLARALSVDPTAAGVLGAVRTFITPERLDELRDTVHCPDGPQPGVVAGAMLIRRTSFLASGGFDESLSGGEAIDWFHRVRSEGMRFATVPDVVLERRIHGDNMTRVDPDVRRAYVLVARAAVQRRRAAGDDGAAKP